MLFHQSGNENTHEGIINKDIWATRVYIRHTVMCFYEYVQIDFVKYICHDICSL